MTTQTTHANPALTTLQDDRSRLARRALYADMAASGLVGALLIFDSAPLATLMGLDDLLLFNTITGSGFLALVGLSFIPILAFILYLVTRHPFETRLGWVQVVLNSAWVALSYLVLLTGALGLSTEGGWLVLIQADLLLAITIAQIVGIRRLKA